MKFSSEGKHSGYERGDEMNDLELGALLIDLQKEMRQLDGLVRDKKLETAFLVAHTMGKQIELFMDRLNRLRWPVKT